LRELIWISGDEKFGFLEMKNLDFWR